MRSPCFATVLMCLFLVSANAQQKGLATTEVDKLVARLLVADDRTDAGRTEIGVGCERLGSILLDKSQLSAWQAKIQKLVNKGRSLEKNGDNWFWPADKKKGVPARGRYIVGGETKKPKGLAITMHGGGLGSADAGSAAAAYEPALTKFGLLMLAPQALEATEHGWTDSGTEEFVLELVDAAFRTWKIDTDKVFFVGHSMGGYGSWTLGAHHADRVAAIAPSAGAPTPVLGAAGGPIIDIQEGVIPSLRNVFVCVYQSVDDPQVPPAPNQFAVQMLAKARDKWGAFEHVYWEVDGRGHDAPPGGFGAQLEKVVIRARDPVPQRVVWQPVLSWKRQFYWLYWETPIGNAVLQADVDRATNTVTISCDKSTDGLWVLLDDRVLDVQKEVVVVVNGTEMSRSRPSMDLGTLVLTGRHADPKLQFASRVRAFAPKSG